MNITTPHTTTGPGEFKAVRWLLTRRPPRTDSMGSCDSEGGAAVRMTCAISDLCSGSRWRPEDAICRAALREDWKLGPSHISRPIRAWDILSVPSPDELRRRHSAPGDDL